MSTRYQGGRSLFASLLVVAGLLGVAGCGESEESRLAADISVTMKELTRLPLF